MCQKRLIFVISCLEKLNFQAVIKSAASAASLGTAKHVQKHAKHAQNMRKTRPNHQNPGLIQKLKVPKWVCRSPLASFCNGPPFFAIFGPARGQIFGKTAEKIAKNRWIFALRANNSGLFCFSGAVIAPGALPRDLARQAGSEHFETL